MRVIFVTGGAGFIGSYFIKYFLRRNKNFIIVNMDKLTYSGNLKNLSEIEDSPRHHFVKGDICNQEFVNYILKRYRPDYIINFAAETNIKRSKEHPIICAQTNLMGTLTLLEGARYIWGKKNFAGNRFIQVSTDEVYGYNDNNTEFVTEESSLFPNSPYAVSKASADMMVLTFFKVHSLPAIIVRCCNTYGPFEYKENFLPSSILNILEEKQLPVNADDDTVREWLHVQDQCVAIIRALFYGKPGEVYNIGSGEGFTETDLQEKILRLSGRTCGLDELKVDKPVSDRFVALNSYKIKNNLNWSNKFSLEEGLKNTISWYNANKDFWESKD